MAARSNHSKKEAYDRTPRRRDGCLWALCGRIGIMGDVLAVIGAEMDSMALNKAAAARAPRAMVARLVIHLPCRFELSTRIP
jgi:hypothetical protein